MPRLARNVFPNIPHHVTQRGNRREDVFFSTEDRLYYLEWLRTYSLKYEVEIMAYCLMTNHIHLILRPTHKDGLHKMLKPLHMRYAQYINKKNNWSGHLWQDRFFSSALDEAYTWSAIRYVERNPLRTGMVEHAEDYAWSSAAVHCGNREDVLLSTLDREWKTIPRSDWSNWLSVAGSQNDNAKLRRNLNKGLPCGNDEFIDLLEKQVGRVLRFRPQGRPGKG